MRPNFPGGYPPGEQWTRDDGGGRRRRKKGGFVKAVGGVVVVSIKKPPVGIASRQEAWYTFSVGLSSESVRPIPP